MAMSIRLARSVVARVGHRGAAVPARGRVASTTASTASRQFSSAKKAASKYKVYKANEVFPTKPKHVTVEINNRDDKQSNAGSAVLHPHTVKLAEMINKVVTPDKAHRKSWEHNYPGSVQSWGGTFPMFALWKRGLLPFAELQDLFAATRGTPTMWLDRNLCLNGMVPYDLDMVRAFFQQIKAAKVAAGNEQPFIMQIFDAVNDPKQLEPVINAYKELGPDFPVMLFYSTSRTLYDPAIMNPRRAAEFFKLMETHAPSDYFGLKQPEGCLSAIGMHGLCHTIKDAFPDKALHVHTQGIHGFSEMQALQAALGGASSIDAAVPFHSMAGQPFSPAIREELIRNGFKVNAWNLEALDDLLNESKRIEALYPQVLTPTRRYPSVSYGANIAGGQSSILRDELDALGLSHLFHQVEMVNPITRRASGSGVAVTPLADIFVRQTMLLVRSGVTKTFTDEDFKALRQKPLLDPSLTPIFERFAVTDAYALLLFGDNGLLPSYPNPTLMRIAGRHLAQLKAKEMVAAGELTSAQLERVTSPDTLDAISEAVLLLSEAVRVSQYKQQLHGRMAELEALNDVQAEGLSIDLQLAGMVDFKGAPVDTIKKRVQLFQEELKHMPQEHAIDLSEDLYGKFLTAGKLSDKAKNAVMKAVPALVELTKGDDALSEKTLLTLMRKSAPLTVAAYLLKTDRLVPAAADVKKWEEELALTLPKEFTTVHAMFKGHVLQLTEGLASQRYTGNHSKWNLLSKDPTEKLLPDIAPGAAGSGFVAHSLYELHDVVQGKAPAAYGELLEALTQQNYWKNRLAYKKQIAAQFPPVDGETVAVAQLHATVGGDEAKIQAKLDAVNARVAANTKAIRSVVADAVNSAPGKFDLSFQHIPNISVADQVQAAGGPDVDGAVAGVLQVMASKINAKWAPAI